MLDKQKILEAALEGIQRYVDTYNEENDAQVTAFVTREGEGTDHGNVTIDGGNAHGAWFMELGEL